MVLKSGENIGGNVLIQQGLNDEVRKAIRGQQKSNRGINVYRISKAGRKRV